MVRTAPIGSQTLLHAVGMSVLNPGIFNETAFASAKDRYIKLSADKITQSLANYILQ